mmetsp:Transcript_57156/g.121520  ORF Transcript_57156/g.121520 Transcript_57156/m.121520 type:complete len:210 (+) Transcript_57156:641-1270(+)
MKWSCGTSKRCDGSSRRSAAKKRLERWLKLRLKAQHFCSNSAVMTLSRWQSSTSTTKLHGTISNSNFGQPSTKMKKMPKLSGSTRLGPGRMVLSSVKINARFAASSKSRTPSGSNGAFSPPQAPGRIRFTPGSAIHFIGRTTMSTCHRMLRSSHPTPLVRMLQLMPGEAVRRLLSSSKLRRSSARSSSGSPSRRCFDALCAAFVHCGKR